MRGRGRVEPLTPSGTFVLEGERFGTGPGFRVVCLCQDEPIELARVENAAETLWSWNLRHAWGGRTHTCPACKATYAYSGSTKGVGTPDVVDLARIEPERTTRLSRLQSAFLDVALERDDAIWEVGARLIREALHLARLRGGERERLGMELRRYLTPDAVKAARKGPVCAQELLAEAMLLRHAIQARKLHELRLIAEELGIEAFPEGVRIFRGKNGAGFVDWGHELRNPLRVRAVSLEDIFEETLDAEACDLMTRKPNLIPLEVLEADRVAR